MDGVECVTDERRGQTAVDDDTVEGVGVRLELSDDPVDPCDGVYPKVLTGPVQHRPHVVTVLRLPTDSQDPNRGLHWIIVCAVVQKFGS